MRADFAGKSHGQLAEADHRWAILKRERYWYPLRYEQDPPAKLGAMPKHESYDDRISGDALRYTEDLTERHVNAFAIVPNDQTGAKQRHVLELRTVRER